MDLGRELQTALEDHIAAVNGGASQKLRELPALLKKAMQAGQLEPAAQTLRRAVLPALDYTSAQSLARVRQALKNYAQGKTPSPLKVAVLSSVTSEQLIQLLDLFLFAEGLDAEIYKADYGVFRQEILDPASGLYAFKPKVLFLATYWRDLAHIPCLTDGREQVSALVDSEFSDWQRLWQTAHERMGCQILQNNFDAPPWRLLDNHEMRHSASLSRHISRMNEALADRAPAFVTVHDIDRLAALAGRWEWGDERFFHHAKLPCAPECLVDYAHSVSTLIAAQVGLGKKCLVLDLDNTLWGGVIGDDGLGGIRLGQGDGEGEAYQSFQRYVKGLRSRGVILAVCSKNEDRIAREVFEKHPEMVLRLEDISCFVANWEDKAANLRCIAKQLNISLNSLVFVDDNPAERAIVRQLTPEVAVPEMPSDVTGYVRALDRSRYFQLVSLNAEDFQRTEMYRDNAAREVAESSAGSVEKFLRSLQMIARIGPVDESTLERTVQLINRSNQFNLTTRRYSAADVMRVVENKEWITRTVTLADRFGDNGLISVLLAKIESENLVIDTWLMSCRVLKRGVEDFLLNHLYEVALSRQVRAIRGEYIPTAKNDLVREHYAKLGFVQLEAAENGHTWWELPVKRDWVGREVYIKGEITTDG